MTNRVVYHPNIWIYPRVHRENDRLHTHGYHYHLPAEIKNWLDNNCSYKWHVDVFKKAIVFENAKEAMRFKLKWL